MASAFLAMEQGKSTENVAANAVEVGVIRVLHGILEKEKCILEQVVYTGDERKEYNYRGYLWMFAMRFSATKYEMKLARKLQEATTTMKWR